MGIDLPPRLQQPSQQRFAHFNKRTPYQALLTTVHHRFSSNLITTTKRTQWEKRGGVGGAKEWWSRLSDGQSVDLGSMGYELKALNMHISMVVDPQSTDCS
jgi:hypothetical protein